jgi:hypothetical protein
MLCYSATIIHRCILSRCYAIVQQWCIATYYRHVMLLCNNDASLHIIGMLSYSATMTHRCILSKWYARIRQLHTVTYCRHYTLWYNNQASLHILGMPYNVGYRRHVTIKLTFCCHLRFFIFVLQDLNHLVTSDLDLMDDKTDSPKFYS